MIQKILEKGYNTESEITTIRHRIEHIDIIKGIGIILMIMRTFATW